MYRYIAKVDTTLPSELTQFAAQVRIRFISQLIKGISRDLQLLLKYFNSTVILHLFKNLDISFNDSKPVVRMFGLFLQN